MLHVYVADFGLSTMKSGTIRQFTAGTPGPEQLKGEDINTHSDVYSFGCNMYELFTENPVWEGLSAHTIMFRVGVKGEYPEISFALSVIYCPYALMKHWLEDLQLICLISSVILLYHSNFSVIMTLNCILFISSCSLNIIILSNTVAVFLVMA